MKSQARFFIFAGLLLTASVGFLVPSSPTDAAPAPKKDNAEKPVEPDMHEFMEYVFQPTFKRLKPVMATEPVNNQDWKTIKADSLILAEGGNLLLIRQPEADSAAWVNHSIQVRDFGGQLYRAAKAKDFKAARKSYESMIMNCNACHKQFAGGEHILTP